MNDVVNYFGLEKNSSADVILKKIHLKRKKNSFPKFIIEFLEKEFLKTNDVRYFNELLWICGDELILSNTLLQHFNCNMKNSKYSFPFDKNLEYCLTLSSSKVDVDVNYFSYNKIALIGNPLHFILPYLKFKKNKIKVDVINVKYHPNKTLKILFNNKTISFLFKCFFGQGYTEITINDKSELKKIKLNKQYDVGFHKLSFIIGNNLISSFSKGLINDHWGALPLFKGRSTLLYSKLFGAKKVVTNHLITKEIDAGKILLYTAINNKKDIYWGLKERVYTSIYLLCRSNFIDVDNKIGEIFYEMHPWLIKQLKK
jgi:hypothetical protein